MTYGGAATRLECKDRFCPPWPLVSMLFSSVAVPSHGCGERGRGTGASRVPFSSVRDGYVMPVVRWFLVRSYSVVDVERCCFVCSGAFVGGSDNVGDACVDFGACGYVVSFGAVVDGSVHRPLFAVLSGSCTRGGGVRVDGSWMLSVVFVAFLSVSHGWLTESPRTSRLKSDWVTGLRHSARFSLVSSSPAAGQPESESLSLRFFNGRRAAECSFSGVCVCVPECPWGEAR